MLKPSTEKDEMIELLGSFVLPEKKDFEFGASYGLILFTFLTLEDLLKVRQLEYDGYIGIRFMNNI